MLGKFLVTGRFEVKFEFRQGAGSVGRIEGVAPCEEKHPFVPRFSVCPSPLRVFCFLPTGGHSSFPPYQRYCIPSPQRCHCLFFSLISPIIYLDQKSWFNNRKCVTPRSFPILLVAVRIGSLIQQIGNVMHLEVGTVSVGSLESPQFLERGSPLF